MHPTYHNAVCVAKWKRTKESGFVSRCLAIFPSLMQMLHTDKQYTAEYMKWVRKSDIEWVHAIMISIRVRLY